VGDGVSGIERTVLIVGAGPTGLVLAADLARRGVTCRIVEEADVRTTAPRAINIHCRSLEVFADLGVAEQAVDLGHQVWRLNSYAAREPAPGRRPRLMGSVDMSRLPSRFPFTLTLQQPVTESLLEERAALDGVKIERRVRLTRLTQDDRGVDVELAHLDADRVEQGRFGWVVGCDGLRSTVREQVGISFEGVDYPDDLISADVEVDWQYSHDQAHTFSGPRGSLRCMPVPGERRWRMVAEAAGWFGEGDRPELTLRGYEELVRQRGVEAALRESHWMSNFHIHRRLASRFRAGRVLLAGDAAHVHSPTGAQGMNIGMQDSYNLGWKLALVVAGSARPELLDTYEPERRAVAARTLKVSDRGTRRIQQRGGMVRAVNNLRNRALLNFPPVKRRFSLRGAELDTHYRDSALSTGESQRRSKSRLQPGDRAPDVWFGPPGDRRRAHDLLSGTGYVLLLFAGNDPGAATTLAGIGRHDISSYLVVRNAGPVEAGERLPGADVVSDPDGALHAAFAAPAGSLCLVRPDGYLGLRGYPADPRLLHGYLDRFAT
jgi:2-polyprenyl-6-methoxyphenol hydroxylase-like FAD-dependent oxidoreductase